MSFKNHDYKKLANQNDILSCVTDAQIFEYYLGGIPSKPISSPLREDNTPSFSLFHSDLHGKLMYKDFATGETGDVFIFLMRLFRFVNITDVFNKVAGDMGLTQFENSAPSKSSRKSFVSASSKGKIKRQRLDIKVKIRRWSRKDQEYWNGKYGFTRKQLEYCGVFPISHYFINGYCKVAEEVAYAFIEEKDGLQTFKIYQPLTDVPENKWVNNNDYSTWELWQQMPAKGKNLIITSSRKDAMLIKSLYPSHLLTACALQSENVNAKDSVMLDIIGRFDNIYILYDNDYDKSTNWGREAGKKFADLYSFQQIEIPDQYKIKDISDFREIHKEVKTKKLIKQLLTQI
tara:strand:- start:47692 stop:48729 length:1038 start_codon:yes stop_codon:yes gene_type:complete